ncbi:MAG: PstS family phosphate ABC transporter substrate-binding protein [Hoeflea sp.]|uniref:PstS family phosphate ABC transporter substrate-binding protein n=1 Tax=Hoeflea sp. TaxID=1940281 RepID=UPI00272F0CDE|nr:PstS family phosphate ABC transporter substrate-binding protein [Hoeflea sp.]MDP2120972.1 PstS family phosphate ABC transporter substrate-binding protein [Hoeflea sp.]MDP3524934.1 PstS family phosphate ABC transporter substrate-binding protein [Hoeflea sp.]
MNALKFAAAALVASTAFAGAAVARDQIKVVGSSTVFPYSQAAAEEYANKSGNPAPVVESLGTGGGFKAFCGGVGPDHPDVTGASRAIKSSEVELCTTNGVTDITEALIGYDGLSMAVSRKNDFAWDLTEEQIFRAVAAELPNEAGELVANPNQMWSDVDPSLPAFKIVVIGPPPTSGTRDAFVELTLHDGCDAIPAIAAIKKDNADKWNEVCSRVRQDGLFIEAGENDNLIVQSLESDPNAVGIFGYSFLYENLDKLKGVSINGVEPTFDTIADGSYPVARPLYFYVKNAHRGVIPGLEEFLAEYVSDEALATGGYLAERGLTPLSTEKLAEVRDAVVTGKKFGM